MVNYLETSKHITLGRGILRVKKDGENSWKDLMHVKDVKINIATNDLKHKNFRKGLTVTDKAITLDMEASGSFQCDVPIAENIALFLMAGDPTLVSQTSGIWTAQSFTVVKPDEAQELGKRFLTITSITDDSGTPVPLVEDVDYTLDTTRGLFTPLSGSAMVGAIGDVFKVTGTYAGQDYTRVAAGEEVKKLHVWFSGDPATGRIQDIRGYANIKPNGDLQLIGDDWENFSFDMTFSKHEDYPLSKCGLYYEDLGQVATD